MKAETQYNDFVGTIAAEFNNDNSFVEFCRVAGVDLEQYNPIGFRFHDSYGKFDIAVICISKIAEDEKLVEIKLERISIEDFFHLFRSLSFVVCDRAYEEYTELSVEESFVLK